MSKPRKLGMKTTYIPNAKADMRHRKKVYQRGRERTGLQREQVVVQMERQIKKHSQNFEREFRRGVPNEQLYDIMEKISHYKAAAEALRKVGGFGA